MTCTRYVAAFLITSSAALTCAEPITVRQTQGATRGFLVVRGEDGRALGTGELTQVAHGDRLTSKLFFHLRDGSVDEETTVFTQRGTFRLVSDHHVQRGPFFDKASDVFVDVAAGTVTTRSLDSDGKPKVEVEHKDMPEDIYNGLVGTALLNVARDTPPFKIGMVAPVGKGRLVKLAIEPAGDGTFRQDGVRRTARIFRIKVELGGVGGVVAPLIGKQPEDRMVWVLEGEVPALVRLIGPLTDGGRVVSIELSGGVFGPISAAER